jgi:hypothetical protein
MANNIVILDANGVQQTLSTIQTGGIHVPQSQNISEITVASLAPTTALQVGGTDGTYIRAFLTDSQGQVKVLVENDITVGNVVSTANIFNATPPNLGNTATCQTQCDYSGSIFVKYARRSQTIPSSINVTTAAAATLLAAQGSLLFSDLSSLVVSIREGSVANVYFGLVVSDGTVSYRYNFLSVDTASQTPVAPLPINFNPPLSASNPNTAWTAKLVTNSGSGSPPTADAVSVDIVANFILQRAS